MDRRLPFVVVGIVAFVLGAALTVLALRLDTSATATRGQGAAITLTGTVQLAADAHGRPIYTLTSGLTTYTLKAGPRKLTGLGSPLNQYVGQSVTITGKVAKGSNEVSVVSVNGAVLRGHGKPAWAGGRMRARFGECFPPGQCKDRSAQEGSDESGEPDESEAPEASEAAGD